MNLTALPTLAASSSWSSPTQALVVDGAMAEQLAGGTAAWIRLTGLDLTGIPSGATIGGFEIGLVLGPCLAGSTYGKLALSYNANLAQATGAAPETYDGNLSTFVGASEEYTVIHDCGAATAVTKVRVRFYSESGDNVFTGSYSSDGSSWTNFSFGVTPVGSPGIHDIVATVGVSARYWRFSQVEPTPGTDFARCYEFALYDASDVLIPPATVSPDGDERVQVALTKDGAAPAGDIEQLTVPVGGGVLSVGGATDLFSETWATGDFTSSFGVLIRRSVMGGESSNTSRQVDGVSVTVYFTVAAGLEMADRIFAEQRLIIGPENTAGTLVTPSILLKATQIELQSADTESETNFVSDLIDHDATPLVSMSSLSLSGKLTYDEIGHIWASVFGRPNTTTVAAGVYEHEFWIDTHYALGNPRTFTIARGDADLREWCKYGIFSGFSMEMSSASDVSISGTGFAQTLNESTGLTGGAAQVWTLALGGYTGSFQLSYRGARTAVLTGAGLTSGALQTALQALGTVGAGGMTVTGSGPYVITAASTVAGKLQPNIDVIGTAVPTVSITTAGGFSELDAVPVGKQDVNLYMADTLVALDAATALGDAKQFSMAIGNRYAPNDVINSDNVPFKAAHVSDDLELSGMFRILANETGQTWAALNNALKWVRFAAISPRLAAAGHPYQILMDMAVRLTPRGTMQRDGVILGRDFQFKGKFDASAGRAIRVKLKNKTASY